MNLKVKFLDIASAGALIVVLDKHDAFCMDLHPNDRILLRTATRKTVAIVDIALSHKTVAEGELGVFEEVAQKLHLKQEQSITLDYAKKPESLQYIKKKLDGQELTAEEIEIIVDDIVRDELTEGELTFFVSACYTKTMSYPETVALTKSMAGREARSARNCTGTLAPLRRPRSRSDRNRGKRNLMPPFPTGHLMRRTNTPTGIERSSGGRRGRKASFGGGTKTGPPAPKARSASTSSTQSGKQKLFIYQKVNQT